MLGKNLRKLGAKRVFNLGILTTGTCSVLFGVLDRIPSGKLFIGISIVVRSVEAVGNSGFLTGKHILHILEIERSYLKRILSFSAIFSMIAKEFPDRVATMFATLEAFFGLGLIFGPSIGGILYQAGGYTLPFVVLGSILICVACVTFFVLPGRLNELLQGRIYLMLYTSESKSKSYEEKDSVFSVCSAIERPNGCEFCFYYKS